MSRGGDVRRDDAERPVSWVVDASNVIGSRPDGWWRDRAGATRRLRDNLVPLAAHGLPPAPGVPDWLLRPPFEMVLVVEGAAKRVEGVAGVRVVSAAGSGDDAIVELVRAEGTGRRCAVATADRGLRDRVAALGSIVIGPRTVRPPAMRSH